MRGERPEPGKLDHDSATPLYQQLEGILRGNIEEGVWLPEQRIPSESELSQDYGLSRMTVRSVLSQLVRDGLLYRVQGKGTFVSNPKITTHSPAYKGIREQLEAMGYETETRLISKREMPAPAPVAQALRLEAKTPVYFIERLRLVQGEPVSLHRSYVPCALAQGLLEYDTVNEQLCVVLSERFSLHMSRVEETLEIASATSEEAALLNVKRGFPLLQLDQIISDGRAPYEHTKVLFRGDKVKISFTYEG